MQMKKVFTTILFLCIMIHMEAQEDAHILDKYFGPTAGDGGTLIGKPMPEFYFNDTLNSNALQGKFIVLDFWATWCPGCVLLTHELNTLFTASSDVYCGVQLIGVDYLEGNVKNREKANVYWQNKKYCFPMVDGPRADSCGISVQASHPSVLVVDDRGIIRGHWSGWTPFTATSIMATVSRLSILPNLKQEVTLENACKFIEQRDWVSALYFLELLPETEASMLPRLECLLHVSKRHALQYTQILEKRFIENKQFTALCEMAKMITDSQVQQNMIPIVSRTQLPNEGLFQVGLRIYQMLENQKECTKDYVFWEKYADLLDSYSNHKKQLSILFIQKSLYQAQSSGVDKATLDRIKQKQEKY